MSALDADPCFAGACSCVCVVCKASLVRWHRGRRKPNRPETCRKGSGQPGGRASPCTKVHNAQVKKLGRVREKAIRQIRMDETLGRVCSFCGASDSVVAWSKCPGRCRSCDRQRQRVGLSECCQAILVRTGPSEAPSYCSRCAWPPTKALVLLISPVTGIERETWHPRHVVATRFRDQVEPFLAEAATERDWGIGDIRGATSGERLSPVRYSRMGPPLSAEERAALTAEADPAQPFREAKIAALTARAAARTPLFPKRPKAGPASPPSALFKAVRKPGDAS